MNTFRHSELQKLLFLLRSDEFDGERTTMETEVIDMRKIINCDDKTQLLLCQ